MHQLRQWWIQQFILKFIRFMRGPRNRRNVQVLWQNKIIPRIERLIQFLWTNSIYYCSKKLVKFMGNTTSSTKQVVPGVDQKEQKCAWRAKISNLGLDRCCCKAESDFPALWYATIYCIQHNSKKKWKRQQWMNWKRGRKPKLTPRCIRSLVKRTRENRFKPLHVITARFNESRAVPAFTRTARRVLEKNGIKNYVAACKPYLNRGHQKRRMQWAVHHQHSSNERWGTLLFSDETSVTVHPKMQRKRVWRQPG